MVAGLVAMAARPPHVGFVHDERDLSRCLWPITSQYIRPVRHQGMAVAAYLAAGDRGEH